MLLHIISISHNLYTFFVTICVYNNKNVCVNFADVWLSSILALSFVALTLNKFDHPCPSPPPPPPAQKKKKKKSENRLILLQCDSKLLFFGGGRGLSSNIKGESV